MLPLLLLPSQGGRSPVWIDVVVEALDAQALHEGGRLSIVQLVTEDVLSVLVHRRARFAFAQIAVNGERVLVVKLVWLALILDDAVPSVCALDSKLTETDLPRLRRALRSPSAVVLGDPSV